MSVVAAVVVEEGREEEFERDCRSMRESRGFVLTFLSG